MKTRIAGLAALLFLTACEGGGDPVEQALRETASANHAATVKATAAVSPSSEVQIGSGAAPADQAYVAEMTEHHRSAIALAEAALKESGDPQVRRMAQTVIDDRTREIAELQAWGPTAAQSASR
jgi:uncharacterized protein (DUF305 family)